ncbi:hypothetical protein BBB56_17715 [Candidatus Pantoea deserta]|uniref:Uncharacterized protein n=1 Tax=Candidatus Pantoea deserta TaxID=1869313 RepID=A0A3N4NKD1_9GAMM|nr:hypothetical protein BBB56_17715 [Pantoea deserta]
MQIKSIRLFFTIILLMKLLFHTFEQLVFKRGECKQKSGCSLLALRNHITKHPFSVKDIKRY